MNIGGNPTSDSGAGLPPDFYGEEYFIDPDKNLDRDSGYRDYRRASVRLRQAMLAFTLFALFQFRTVLDAGCAFGFLVDAAGRLGKLPAGIDISRFALREAVLGARQRLGAGSVDRLPFRDRAFDLTVCQEVLEHLPPEKIEPAVLELRRVSGGLVFLTVPLAPWADGLVPEMRLPLDRRGFPHHGHLTVADGNWWRSKLVRCFKPWVCVDLSPWTPARPVQGVFAFSRGVPPFASPQRAPRRLLKSLLSMVFR